MLLGYETNLDHSPRLAEITLTVPEGPIDLPLLNPLTPRRGAAALTELSWQVARSPEAGRIWRAGVNVGARAATAQSKTDWHHVQFAGSGSQQWGPWRGQLELSSTWIGGPLNEPYRLLRVSATGERDALGCTLRLAAETEAHTQQVTSSSDGRTVGVLWSSLCPLAFARNWAWGAAVRASVDQPVDANRPGGTQRQWSIGTRLLGNVGAGVRIDLSARVSRVQDDEGYSALLESNAARRLSQSQVSLELTRPLNLSWWPGAEALLQWQAVRQASNLSVFRRCRCCGGTTSDGAGPSKSCFLRSAPPCIGCHNRPAAGIGVGCGCMRIPCSIPLKILRFDVMVITWQLRGPSQTSSP
jgi:hypothetical protein